LVTYLHKSWLGGAIAALASLGTIAAALGSLGAITARGLASIVHTGFFNFDISTILTVGNFLLIHLIRRS
jgi:hypothetical protein